MFQVPQVSIEYVDVLSGRCSGTIAQRLLKSGLDVNQLRPFVSDDERDDRSFVNVPVGVNNEGKTVCETRVTNAPGLLRIREWMALDTAVVTGALARLQFANDIKAAGLTYDVPNAMGKTVLQYQTVVSQQQAIISMDAARRSQGDRPVYDSAFLPLPIISADFDFTLRELETGRQGGVGIDDTQATMAGYAMGEVLELLSLGINPSYAYGGGTIYGATNFPGRMTGLLSLPTGIGWTPGTLIGQILTMIGQAVTEKHYGPYRLYFSPGWMKYLEDDYSSIKGTETLLDRIKRITRITDIRTLDFLPDYRMLMIQMTPNVVRMVMGFGPRAVQWETDGGMQVHYKSMMIEVPQFRSDAYGNTGVVDAVAA
jgi:hypothetical protein